MTGEREAAANVSLEADGRDVPLNEFVRTVLRNVVLAFVSSLKGVGKPRRIVIRVEAGDGKA